MRFSTLIATVLATATPAIVSAATKGTMGFALGTKMANGECKTQQDYEADFDAIKAASGLTLVRGYAASDCDMAKNAVPAAKAKGFKVMLGIWYVLSIPFAIFIHLSERNGWWEKDWTWNLIDMRTRYTY